MLIRLGDVYYQMAGAEDADDKNEQAGNVPLPPFSLARVVIPQTRRLEHCLEKIWVEMRKVGRS